MGKLYYCAGCKRVTNKECCEYCKDGTIKELNTGAPVNIIGTKLKGKVLKIDGDNARLLVRDENNNRFIKEYEANKLRKII